MQKVIASILISLGLVLVPVATTAGAIDLFPDDVCGEKDCAVVKAEDSALDDSVQNIINMAIYLIGGVAVIMLIAGAIRIVSAQGDPGNIKAGRLAVIWSVVGVAVAVLSSVIVNFVINWDWKT